MPNQQSPTFAGVSLPLIVVESLRASCQHGLILFSGPTGSGKVTHAITALLELFDRDRYRIMAVVNKEHGESPEDRIFSRLKERSISLLSVDGEIQTLESVIHRAIISDTEVFYLGEIRDEKSFQLANNLVRAGITVFATIHGLGCQSAIYRLNYFSKNDPWCPCNNPTVISSYLIDDGTRLVPILQIRPRTAGSISGFFRSRDFEREHPSRCFTSKDHIDYLIQHGLLSLSRQAVVKMLPADYMGEVSEDDNLSAAETLRAFSVPRKILPFIPDDDVIEEIKSLLGLGWSMDEIASFLTSKGFAGVNGALLQSIVWPVEKKPLAKAKPQSPISKKRRT